MFQSLSYCAVVFSLTKSVHIYQHILIDKVWLFSIKRENKSGLIVSRRICPKIMNKDFYKRDCLQKRTKPMLIAFDFYFEAKKKQSVQFIFHIAKKSSELFAKIKKLF